METRLKIIECIQGDESWFEHKRGLVSGSTVSDMLARQQDASKDGVRKKLLFKLCAEILTGETIESYKSADMERGSREEPEARALYEMLSDEPVTQIGLGINDRLACSPDSLVGDRGGLEIKSMRADLLIQAHERNGAAQAKEHYAQCQANMAVFERDWWDLFLYNPKIKPLKLRIERDAAWIVNMRTELRAFYADLDRIVAKHRG